MSAACSSGNLLMNVKFIRVDLRCVPTCCARKPSDQPFLCLLGVMMEMRDLAFATAIPRNLHLSPVHYLHTVAQLSSLVSMPRCSLHPSSGEREQERFQIHNQIIT